MSWEVELKKNARYRLEECWRMLELSFQDLDPELLWKRPNSRSNSLGNQLLHMRGNLGQYIWSTLGQHPDVRDREAEFSAQEGDFETLWKELQQTLTKSLAVIEQASSSQLLATYHVQAYQLSGIGLILHAVEHFSYHTGQVAFWIKNLTNRPLDFYKDIDLNQKHR